MAVKRNYRINLRNYGNPPAVMVSQYDENYDLVFEVYDGVVPATGLNAYTVKLVGRQPGEDPALKYEFTGTVSGIANNILSFTIDTTMTGRAGKGTAEIVILDTTNDVKFASFNLPVYVEKAAVPDDAIDADVERAQEIADEVQDIVDTAAAEVKGEAEAWAVGERDGEPVPSTDPAYHNNAKYYSEVAQDIADSIGIDATLSVAGKAADAKKTGDEISSLKEDLNDVVPYPESPDSKYGTAGQLLRTKGNGKTEWVDEGLPTDEQTAEAVTAWLNDHPEATTTVQDGSLTEAKFSNALKLKTIKDYVTPEMFGAVGDGETDDSTAFTNMFVYIESVKVTGTRYACPQILLTKIYNIGSFSVPNNFYHDLMFIGGVIIGEITFPSNSFYTLQFYGTTFRNSDGFALILNPNRTVEYKTCLFMSCRFMSKNGVKTDTRSILLTFDTCTFQSCDFAYYGGDTDKVAFKNCWFDTKINKSASDLPYTIYINGSNESACVIDSCIVVNATTNKGDYNHTAFVGTKGEVCFTNTRLSNEAATNFYAVEFLADTLAKLSTGHVTGCVFNGCDVGNHLVYLLGIPSLISITGCMGNPNGEKLIVMDSSLTDVYKTRPALRITIKDNAFDAFNAVKTSGNSDNACGINLSASLLPTIPYELYYAVNRNYKGQNDPLIVPLTNGYKYSVATNTTVDLLKFIKKGTTYNDLYINGKSFFVKYTAQTPSTNVYKHVMDVVSIDRNGSEWIITKTNIYGSFGTVNYSMSVDENNTEYTLSMLSSDKILHGVDYGMFDNGFATI